jgi:hypothetical protein
LQDEQRPPPLRDRLAIVVRRRGQQVVRERHPAPEPDQHDEQEVDGQVRARATMKSSA